MITGDIKNKVDAVWDAFWTGGISNPLEVMEQITYLLFIRRLDDEQTLALEKANLLGTPLDGNPFPEGTDDQGLPYNDLRWSVFKDRHADEMFDIVANRVSRSSRTCAARSPRTRIS